MNILANHRHEAFAREVALFNADPDVAYGDLVAREGAKRRQGNGYRLLRRSAVAERVRVLSAAAMEKAAELAGVDRSRALAEQARIAYSNILDFVEIVDGVAKMKAIGDIPRDKAAAIQAISYDSNGRLRIKLHDKTGALTALLRATEPQSMRDGDEQHSGRQAEPAHTSDEPWPELVPSQHPQTH